MGLDFMSGMTGSPTIGDLGGSSTATSSGTLTNGSININSSSDYSKYLIIGGVFLILILMIKKGK